MALSIDIVSDVVCPWCYIGKRRLEAALALYRERRPDAPAPAVTFHPFELNPDMPREGVSRADYIAKKFGARGYSAHDRLVNKGAQGAMKEALLKAFFVDSLDLTDEATLVKIASEAGLDGEEAKAALADEGLRRLVAEEEDKARAMGISGVPFFIFNQRLAVEGAQPPDTLLDAMLEAEKEAAAA